MTESERHKHRKRETDLHGERERVDDDEDEDAVLEAPRRDEPPDFVLEPDAWNVAALWLHFQRELDALPLQRTNTHTHIIIIIIIIIIITHAGCIAAGVG